jgi:hypothetical protein
MNPVAPHSTRPFAETYRTKVLEFISERGEEGATDEEGIAGLGLSPSTFRPRRIELMQAGLVEDSGQRRLTAAGRSAIVWRAKGAAPPPAYPAYTCKACGFEAQEPKFTHTMFGILCPRCGAETATS